MPTMVYSWRKNYISFFRCNEGFTGSTCTPEYQLDSSIHADFRPRYDLFDDFIVKGGEVVRPGEGCGNILSGESIYFSEVKVNSIISKTMHF